MKREVFTPMVHDYRGDAIEGSRLYALDEEGKAQIQYWRTGKELNDHVSQRITIPVELLEGLMILANAYQRKGMPFEEIPKLF